MIYFFGKLLCWVIAKTMGRFTIIGREHIPASGGFLVAANHTSYADPPLIGLAFLPHRIHFMAKSELFASPILGYIIRRLNAFPVKRASADRQALRHADKLLTGGSGVTVFFEGTRSFDGRLQPPELGPALIALRAGVPVVPAALIDADRLLPREGGLKRARVTCIIGEPLAFPHLAGRAGDRDALREVSLAIARAVAELLRAHGASGRVPPGYPETPQPTASTT